MADYIIVNGELYHADELYHHGVKGMKWGERRAYKKAAEAERKASKDKAFEEFTRELDEKQTVTIPEYNAMVKGHNAKVREADKKYKEAMDNPEYKQGIKNAKKKAGIALAAIGATAVAAIAVSSAINKKKHGGLKVHGKHSFTAFRMRAVQKQQPSWVYNA